VGAVSAEWLRLVFLAGCLAFDVLSKRIPNLWVSAGLGAALLSGPPPAGWVLGLWFTLFLFGLWRRGWLGGGDVKAAFVLSFFFSADRLLTGFLLAELLALGVFFALRRAGRCTTELPLMAFLAPTLGVIALCW